MPSQPTYDPARTPLENFLRRHGRRISQVRRFVRGPLVAIVVGVPLLWIGVGELSSSPSSVTPAPRRAKATARSAKSTTTSTASTTTTNITIPPMGDLQPIPVLSSGVSAAPRRVHRRAVRRHP